MNSKNIFFNDIGRLRSGWRFLLFLFSYSFFSITATVGAVVILSALPIGFSQSSLLSLAVIHFISFLCALVIGLFFGKFLEDLPFRALGWTFSNNWLKHLV